MDDSNDNQDVPDLQGPLHEKIVCRKDRQHMLFPYIPGDNE